MGVAAIHVSKGDKRSAAHMRQSPAVQSACRLACGWDLLTLPLSLSFQFPPFPPYYSISFYFFFTSLTNGFAVRSSRGLLKKPIY